jgi:sulfur relay (sulfurtransferase) DsrC/TusE family protein
MREAILEATFPTTLTHFCHCIFFNDSQFLKKFLSLRTLKDYSVSSWKLGNGDESETLPVSVYIDATDTLEPPIQLKKQYTRSVKLSSEIQTPKVIGVNEGSVLATSHLVWHSESHFTDDMTIEILSELPMKDSFFFSFKWDVKTDANQDVVVRLEIRSSFNKNIPMVSSLIETGMDGYLKKLAKKWIEQAASTIDEELDRLDAKQTDNGEHVEVVKKKLPPPPVPPKKSLPPIPQHLRAPAVAGADDLPVAPTTNEAAEQDNADVATDIEKKDIIEPKKTTEIESSPISTPPTPTIEKRERKRVVIVDTSPPTVFEVYFYWIMGLLLFVLDYARQQIEKLFPETPAKKFVDIGVNTDPIPAVLSDQSVQL